MIEELFAGIGIIFGFALGWMVFSTKLAKFSGLAQLLEQTQRERTLFHERAVSAETEYKSMERRLAEQQKMLRDEFQNTATTILETLGSKFSTQSEKQISDLLNPLRERLGDFQKLVVDSFATQGKEQHTLKSEIEKIVLQTDGLTKALRGDVKAQGNWGEVILERILEESGLQKGVAYVVQSSESDAEGNRFRPDVTINLPDNKHIIVDSKVSLTAYERYCAEADDKLREAHLKDFLKSVKSHVNGLEQKRYQDLPGLSAPDFVLMFMPIEGAYSLAVQQDRELHAYAWGKKIVIVCPSTLFVSLQTIASLWRIETQNRYAQEIARQGGALYDKFVGFIEDMGGIGDKIGGLQRNYDAAMNKLSSGRGNLVASAEKLKALGVKSSKTLPKSLQTDASEENTFEALEAH